MSYSKNILAANATWDLVESAGFFRLMATTGAVKVGFYKNGSLLSEVENVQAGFWRKGEIDRVRITDQSAASNTIEIMQDENDVGYDRSVGSVSISGTPTILFGVSGWSQASATVTNAAAQLVASSGNRRYLLVQNNDAAGSIYLNFGGTATLANGFKIPPGGVWEWNTFQSSQAVSAIGSIASNANIITITA